MQILKDCNISIVNVYRQVLGIAKSRVSNHVDLNLYYTSAEKIVINLENPRIHYDHRPIHSLSRICLASTMLHLKLHLEQNYILVS